MVIPLRRKDLLKLGVLLVLGYTLFLSLILFELTSERYAHGAEWTNDVWRNEQDGDFEEGLGSFNTSRTVEPKPLSVIPVSNPMHSMNESKPKIKMSKTNLGFAGLFQDHFIYSAFIDTRDTMPYIRFIALVHTKKSKIGWCYFKSPINNSFSDMQLSSKLAFYVTCESHSKTYAAYILSCAVPTSVRPILSSMKTVAVADMKLVHPSQMWTATEISLINTNLAVIRDSNLKRNCTFGVCIPPLFGNISVYQLVEFIELTRILGANHFIFYNFDIKQPIKNVLRYYEKLGIVSVMPWQLPVWNEDDVWYYGQSVAIGDCLLRSMYHFDWVSFNDIDEFIISQNDNEMTWDHIITSLEYNSKCDVTCDKIATYTFKSAYFSIRSREVPFRGLVTQETTLRTVTLSKFLTKQLVKPERVFEKGIHHLSKQFREEYRDCLVDPNMAYLHHYAVCKNKWGIVCSRYVEDVTALRYRLPLQVRVGDVLAKVMDS